MQAVHGISGGESDPHLSLAKKQGIRGKGIVGRGVYRSYYKGHKDKIKGEGGGGGGLSLIHISEPTRPKR